MKAKSALNREGFDKDSKMAWLHIKSSTQRLHDRINIRGYLKITPEDTEEV